MAVNDVVIRIAGESGEGIVTIGEVFVRIAAFSGLEVYTFRTFPSEIRGGNVIFQARVADHPVLSQGDRINVLVALNQESYLEHIAELGANGVLVFDSDRVEPAQSYGSHMLYPVPCDALTKELDFPRGINLVVIGVLVRLMGLSLDRAREVVERRLGGYKELLPKNLESLEAGYKYAYKKFVHRPSVYLEPPEGASIDKLVMTGNQALAVGALASGCRFFAGYPITPATEIMEFLAAELPRMGGTLIQAEDEIAAINMVMGASFAGAPALTSTSGPGLALMIEGLGLASMAEVPVVIVDVQRAGPATGMPTKTSQGDLYLAFYAGNDEPPRFVLAPSSVEDCFVQMINAFNLAEAYQMPSIVLIDQALAPRVETWRNPFPDGQWPIIRRTVADLSKKGAGFKRYRITENGVSPMSIPGMRGGEYTADGLEHDERGKPDHSPKVHEAMMDKRWRKVDDAREAVFGLESAVERWGDRDAAIGIMGWGSTLGPVKEAMARAQADGFRVEALFPKVLFPMPDNRIRRFIRGRRAIIIPELNVLGQFARVVEHRYTHDLVRDKVDIVSLNKYQGLPFSPSEIYNEIVRVADALTRRVRTVPSQKVGLSSVQ